MLSICKHGLYANWACKWTFSLLHTDLQRKKCPFAAAVWIQTRSANGQSWVPCQHPSADQHWQQSPWKAHRHSKSASPFELATWDFNDVRWLTGGQPHSPVNVAYREVEVVGIHLSSQIQVLTTEMTTQGPNLMEKSLRDEWFWMCNASATSQLLISHHTMPKSLCTSVPAVDTYLKLVVLSVWTPISEFHLRRDGTSVKCY